MDTLTVAQRSERMARIRSKDTAPEMRVRKLVHGLGYRFRLHRRDLPGCPDLTFPSRRKVIFVHGCFWHSHEGCKVANQPKSNSAFWQGKFARNKARDIMNVERLQSEGWEVLTIWECETIPKSPVLSRRITSFLGGAKARSAGLKGRKGAQKPRKRQKRKQEGSG